MEPTISGRASTAITAPAIRNDCPVTLPLLACWERKPRKLWEKMISPKIASTMLGTPAIISIPSSTSRASHAGRRYSVSQVAIPIPAGPASPTPTTVTISVPTIGSRKPPDSLWRSDGAGDCTNSFGCR